MDFFKNGTGWCVRHDPKKQPALVRKSQAPIFRKLQAASLKHQALETPSDKLQAQSSKLQAPSLKRQAP